eukprot:SAG31_NODE_2825_length_5038_cov_2.170277_7_plen_143_part_00
MTAVAQEGLALQYARRQSNGETAPTGFSSDEYTSVVACQQKLPDLPALLPHVDVGIRSDAEYKRKWMLAAVSNNGLSLRLARSELQRDREIVLSAVRCNGQALFYAHGTLQMDKDIVSGAGVCQHFSLQFLFESKHFFFFFF